MLKISRLFDKTIDLIVDRNNPSIFDRREGKGILKINVSPDYIKWQRHTWIREKYEEFLNRKNVEEQCTQESLMRLHEAFLVAEKEAMNEMQLQDAFKNILNISMTDEEFHVLFMKVNLKRDGSVTWDEFISHLLLEFQEKDVALQRQMLKLPLIGLPETLRTRHRCPVCRITFCPEVLPDRSSSFLRGCYLTASRDGAINYWSLDLEYERSVQSMNPQLKIRPTAITDMIAMPDIQIVCTSSTERDLRFYDTVAKKFDLRLMISSFEHAVTCMSYYFSVDIKENSYIILGDMSGSVRVMSFSPLDKGPFKLVPEQEVLHLRYEAVADGELKGMKLSEFKNIHSNWVSQVAYYDNLRAFISCSRCSECSLLLSDPTTESNILATGGPDCIVRVWNPFVPKKASSVFQGHHAAICALIVQDKGKRIYSLSKDRCVKVWDVFDQSCIQTYNSLPSELSEHTPMSVVYNAITHKMIIASMLIAVLVCDPVINHETSDGYTHTKPVTCVLYNHLFKVVVTTGLDSCIIVWDPWRGRRLYLVTNAHSVLLYGQYVGIEITAACFDTSEQLLLTGARDGTLKMWNFNTGTCIRNMAIEDQCEITSIVWLKNRILCTGWNRHVTEFADTETGIHTKRWETRHTDDILCTAVKFPQVLATSTYNGEMILWRLETGQPYRRYHVSNPPGRYTIVYKKEARDKLDGLSVKLSKDANIGTQLPEKNNESILNISTAMTTISSEQQPSALNIVRPVAIHAMIFLTARPMAPKSGSIMVSLESGLIQVWSHHASSGFLVAFSAIHTRGDYAISLATDPKNDYLITGHTVGYIKVWLLTNYALPDPPHVCLGLLNLEFPFLWKDRIPGRAKRAAADQKYPMLLSSVQAHTKSVNALEFIPSARIVISGSSDHSVRLWSLSGRYISTLGTYTPWIPILPDVPIFKYYNQYKLPPDIKRIASFTTMKVFHGGNMDIKGAGKSAKTELAREVLEHDRHILYGKRLSAPILGHYHKLPSRSKTFEVPPILDNSLAYIPVYTHLLTYNLEPIEMPETPPFLKREKSDTLDGMLQKKLAKPAQLTGKHEGNGTNEFKSTHT
ncbi:WD repeat-containing protein on Y chromosome isoform X2 [Cephus cinctus]|uniref:WD repeat-containing protein on Y chromosome n=1 Tax=Cephus cinctus TaxID=211228 RepID=A0AAJ7R9C2_CEPCN|nr:WD repeat-containing protein on Y chromosome isoform X2 [Cephus cinctus]